MLTWQTRDAEITEWLDAEQINAADLDRNLRDIRHINALLGWTGGVTRAVVGRLRQDPGRDWSLLDVASGSADIPIAIAQAARRAGLRLRVVATDRSARIVEVARAQSAGMAGLSVERRDALALPYPDGAFDIALCTLALHHFAPDEARRLLASMARVGREVLVFDVVRSPLAYAGVVALTRLGRMHPMTCHDGPASVRRAYSADEARALARDAGLRQVDVHVTFPYRLIISARGAAATAEGAAHAL